MDIKEFFNENEKPLDKLISDCGFCSIFRTLGCVGDSLSSGEFEVKTKDQTLYIDMYDYSWGQFMARAMGSKVYNFSRGGMTAQEYMESFAEANGFWDKDKACQGYIIALGVNDILNGEREIGTVDDIKDDYRHNNSTFAGYYGAIIQRLKEIQPDAKFFLMTVPKDSGRSNDHLAEGVAKLIYELAVKFENTYVLDFYKYAPEYDAYFQQKFNLHGHMNPCGYALTAKMVMSYIDYIIRHNMDDFKNVGLIGFEYNENV